MTPNSKLRTPNFRVADLATEVRRKANDRGGNQRQEEDDDHDPLWDSAGFAEKKQPCQRSDTQGSH